MHAGQIIILLTKLLTATDLASMVSKPVHQLSAGALFHDDLNQIATLIAFGLVCRDCDPVLHFGKTLLIGGRKGDEAIDDLADQAIAHLMKVNGITKGRNEDDHYYLWLTLTR